MTSRIIVNNIQSDAGVSTVFFNSDIGGTGGTLNVDGNLNVSGVVTYDDVTNIDSVGVITARNGLHVTSGLVSIGTDNPTNAYGIDKSLHVHSSLSSGTRGSGVHLTTNASGNTANDGVSMRLVDTDLSIDNRETGLINFLTAGTERLRLKSDGKAYFTGNLGLGGQTSPASTIHINNFGNDGYELKLTGNALQFNRTSNSYIDQLNDSGNILFRMTSSNTEAMRITSGGNVGINQISPAAPLSFNTGVGQKIELYNSGSNNQFGFGIQSSEMRICTGASSFMSFYTDGYNGNERLRITSAGNLGIGGLTNPGALLSIPAGESNTPRLAIESAVDDNDFTITQYEDGNGTYTMLGQNVKLNSSGNNTILDSGHRTAGILFDARNHGAITFLTGGTNSVSEHIKITSEGYPWIQNKKTTSFTNNSTVTILTIGDHTNAVVKFMLHASDGGYRQHEWAGEYTAFVSNAAGSPGVSYYLKEHWQDFGSGNWSSPTITVSINGSGQVQFIADNHHNDANGTVDVVILSVTSTDTTIPTIS